MARSPRPRFEVDPPSKYHYMALTATMTHINDAPEECADDICSCATIGDARRLVEKQMLVLDWFCGVPVILSERVGPGFFKGV